jgi:Xaa-Pro dipeptidase
VSIFERSEHLERIARVKERMVEAGIDVLVIESPENIFYLTGYEGWSFYTHQAAIVAQDHDEPILVVRQMDTACADFSVFMRPENIIGYPENYIGVRDRHPMQFIAGQVRDRGWGRLRIGVEMDAHFFTARAFAVLRDALPDAQFIDAYLLVNWVRTYKSDAEVALMRQAGRIAELAMRAAIEGIEVGVRECDVAARVRQAQIAGTPEFGGSVPSDLTLPSGPRSAAPHLSWSDAPFARNVAVNIELGGARNNYHSGLARTVYLGKPPADLIELSKITIDGLHAALAAVRPGITCEDVEAVWRRRIAQAGYEKKSRIGYAIGLCFSPAWLELTASLQPGDRTVLEPNMTFHMICGMWQGEHQGNYNMVTSESFLVTDGGHELLSDLNQKLFVKR